MEVVALSGAKLLVLMVAGSVFSLAGLWLLLRPKPEGGAAKVEIFGMKFESSSAGLLVFLIGAAFLAAPLIVPERDAAAPAASAAAPASTGAASAGAGLIPPRVRASGKEHEPNDGYDAANQITVGDSIAGDLRDGAADWFVIPVDEAAARLFVKVRNNREYCGVIEFYAADERSIGRWDFPNENTVRAFEVPLPSTNAVFMSIPFGYCSYEFFTSYDPIE